MRIAAVAALALLAGCAGSEPCGGAPGATAAMAAIIAADNARDLDRVMTLYTDDVVWRPPGRPPVAGADAIRASYLRMYGDFLPELAITTESARASGRRAALSGRTSGVLHPARPEIAGARVNDRYDAILRCEGRAWAVSEMSWRPAD